MHKTISKAVAQKICDNEGINIKEVLVEPQLLKSGAKLRFRTPRYYIGGYAASGIDVERTLAQV